MATVRLEPGLRDPESDTLYTRPPRRDAQSPSEVLYELFPRSLGIHWYWQPRRDAQSPSEVLYELFPRSIGIHIGLMSALGLLIEFPSSIIWAASLIFLIFQCGSCPIIFVSSHAGLWSPFDQACSAMPDFSTSPRTVAFRCSWSLTASGLPVSPV